MRGLNIGFDSPGFLLLLLLLPLLWLWSFKSLAGLGPARRIFALSLRTIVFTLLVLALANTQLRRTSETMTVIYLLDQSASIPQAQREAMVEYVVKDVELHREDRFRDRASVIVFGRQAAIEVPPLDDNLPILGRLESMTNMRTDATDVSAAMKLAQATFPEGTARRVVIVSDGNENLGSALGIARQLVEDGVGIDVVPVQLDQRGEVSVERVALPADIRKGQPFEARVVLNNDNDTDEAAGVKPVSGRLKLIRRMGSREEVLDEQQVVLDPGKTVYRFEHEIDQPDFYELQAIFTADDRGQDRVTQNNRATAFTHVRGQGHVLVIEDWENRDPAGEGECSELVNRLRKMNLEITVQFTDELFTSLAELQRYDTVILANVPRSSGTSADNLTNFSDAQVEMLVRNTQQMGCGLIMIGGQNAFGAGGWANTELEKAMPVDFQIRNAKVQAVGALAMIMHASEMAEGNHWQKVIAREALKTLGPQDYCGIVHWDGLTFQEGWLWGKPKGLIQVGNNRDRMIARVDQMTPGDMPEFDPALRMCTAAFSSVPAAAVKHMIVISDGDPSPPRQATLSRLKSLGVKITTVAVGTHGPPGSTPLQRIASFTGGKYYVVRNPNALPRIYQKEARRVARPLLVEREITPKITSAHEILNGVDAFPPTKGFVMTHRKDNPLAEVSLLSPYPADEDNATILASWTYGLGRTAVLTTDAGKRWATAWTGWDQYDKFFSQLVRWSMRPTGDTGNFSVSTTLKDGQVRLIIDALDKDDNFLNFLNVSAAVVSPTMDSTELSVRQTAPGRYVGEFTADKSGSYFLTIMPGAGMAPIRTGINVPYSAEFRDRVTNHALLMSLAELEPTGGQPGKQLANSLDEMIFKIRSDDEEDKKAFDAASAFRRNLASAVSSNYVWPWLALITGCLFFGDVFVRRVAVSFAWVMPMIGTAVAWIARREPETPQDDRLERLRSRKAQIEDSIDRQKAAARFEIAPDEEVSLEALEQPNAPGSQGPKPARQDSAEMAPAEEEDDYTARLLKAKKRVWEDKDMGKK